MTDIYEVLTKAREVITDPDHWDTGALAYNVDDIDVHPNSPEAVKWCAMGAVAKVMDRDGEQVVKADYDEVSDPELIKVMTHLKKYTPGIPEEDSAFYRRIYVFNDNLGGFRNTDDPHQDVLDAFDKAIANAPAETTF